MSAAPRAAVQGSQTLARGLRTIEIIAEAPDGLAGAEIARALDVHQSIAYRLLQTLVQFDVVRRDPDNRYRVGLTTIRLAESATGGLRSVARPVLETLAEETGCSSWLFVESGENAVAVLAVEPGPFSSSSRFAEGSRHPLTRGAAGYALLSLRPPSSDDLPPVLEARVVGYAVSHGEIAPAAWGLGVPVDLSAMSVRACIHVAGRSEEQVLAAVPAVHEARARFLGLVERGRA